MKPSIYPVVADYPGRLFIMPKPSGDRLQDDLEHYNSMGANTVISMLAASEIDELSLHSEGDICAENQMGFINFPIPDLGLPERESFKDLIRAVSERLADGEAVAVHCWAGIGRSGMLVCSVLAGFVGSAQEAIEIVSQARGVKVPDTPEQRAFIISVAQELMR